MGDLQQALLRNDQTIRGVSNDDGGDLARRARVTASHYLEGADPGHVIDGHVRDVPGQWTHRWGAPMGGGEAWLELAWDEPVRLSRVQITFDSGFHRELTLSASDGVTRRMVRGPQPETVRDYRIVVRAEDGDEEVASVSGNHQRLRRHDFESRSVRAVRLIVAATHGSKEARVFEVRCYA
jgi:hypothetical protein